LSYAPEHRLVLASHVGRHEENDAHALMSKTKARLGVIPQLFVSDGWDAYIEALLGAFHRLKERPRTGRAGRPPGPLKIPDPQLRYAQLVKVREKGRVVATHKRVIFGGKKTLDLNQVSTSLIERKNLSFRQDNRRLSRKTIAFSKRVKMLNYQVNFYRAFSNFVKTHPALRLRTNGKGAGKARCKWLKRTPAMSVGATDHVWSFRELLVFKPVLYQLIIGT
jgi:hypothetical protein